MQENRAELGKDFDTTKYIAGAIVVFDLHLQKIQFVQHLDLSTDHTQYRAYIYSAPTLADLDLDGKLEIVVGTSMVMVLAPSGNRARCSSSYSHIELKTYMLCLCFQSVKIMETLL